MSAAIRRQYSWLKGELFSMFRPGTIHFKPHPKDTRREEYFKVIDNYLVPPTIKLAPDVPGFPDKIKQFYTYCFPPYSDTWYFIVELYYQTVADRSHQTKENITKAQILRGILDMGGTACSTIDDVSDFHHVRKGKVAYHNICHGGPRAAMFHGYLMGDVTLVLLKEYFCNHPAYRRILESFNSHNMGMMSGQTLDCLSRIVSPEVKDYKTFYYQQVSAKTGDFLKIGPHIALLLAGIQDEDILQKTVHLVSDISNLIQIWDDFSDHYCSMEATGKMAVDVNNSTINWNLVAAMDNFNPAQLKEFREWYWTNDPQKEQVIRRLYDEVNLTDLYVQYMAESYAKFKDVIATIPHPKIQEATTSYLEWLVGPDVLEFRK